MKKRIISVVAILLAVVCCMAQSRESDRLFAIGVEKYNAGDYNGAIGCFERVDSIDTAELDSISPAASMANCGSHHAGLSLEI